MLTIKTAIKPALGPGLLSILASVVLSACGGLPEFCEQGMTSCMDESGTTACVNLQSSTRHCGECNKVCPSGSNCHQGQCSTADCPLGLSKCADKGAKTDAAVKASFICVNSRIDPKHCGKCGNECSPATPVCVDSVCMLKCPAGLAECDKQCDNTKNDPDNCGGCSTKCGSCSRW